MKNFTRILSVVLVLMLAVSSLAISASAAEFQDYYEVPEYFFGDVDFDQRITVKDATAIQKHLAKIITLDEDALYFGDVDGNEKITIGDATLIQKYVAKMIDVFPVEVYAPDYSCKADGEAIDVELTQESAVDIMITVEEAGFYNISATAGGETTLYLEITSEDLEGYWIAQHDGETAYAFAYLEPGTYYAYMYIESGFDTTVGFKVSPTDDVPFDMEQAVELNIGDKVEVKAGEAPLVYKVDVTTLEILDDTICVYTEGDDPKVTLMCYDANYGINSTGMPYDENNTMVDVYDDGLNTVYYIVVTQEEGGSDFTLCCDTSVGMVKKEAKELTLGTIDEIAIEEYVEEYEGETFTTYVGQAIYKFTPIESGYYSFNFEGNAPFSVMAIVADIESTDDGYIIINASEEGEKVFDVVSLEAGKDYYIIAMVYLEVDGNVSFCVLNSNEEEYLEAQKNNPLFEATEDEIEYTEISVGDTVNIEFAATDDEFVTKDFVFTADEDCTIVLYSEGSEDACVYIYDIDGMPLHIGDDIPLFDLLDFAVIGTVEKGETVYFSIESYSETGDSFTFNVVSEADYTPIA